MERFIDINSLVRTDNYLLCNLIEDDMIIIGKIDFIIIITILASGLFHLRIPPLVSDPGETRGVLMKMPDPKNFPPAGG